MTSAQLGKYLAKEEQRLGRPLSAWELLQLGRNVEKKIKVPTATQWKEARHMLDKIQRCYPQVTMDENKYAPNSQGRLIQQIRHFLMETDTPTQKRRRRKDVS